MQIFRTLEMHKMQIMNTNIVISLDTRRQKKDGTYPLMMRLGHNERTTAIPIGINLLEKDWDIEKRLVKKSYEGSNTVTRLNNIIQKKKADAMDIILGLHEAKQLPMMSVIAVKDKIITNNKPQSVFTFAENLIKDLISENRIGTARSYKEVISVLKKYNGGKDLSFFDLTYTFLKKYETYYMAKGNSYNGLAAYMRSLRAICNKAIKAGIVEKNNYPFEEYKIKTTPTEKRALEWDLIKNIIQLDLASDHMLFNARNYFVASYMMYGMNYTDMAFLKRDDIQNGRVTYRRRKTSKLYDIKITEALDKIISYYIAQDENSEYVFPIIKRENLSLQYKDIQWARKRYNKKLKLIAKECGIDSNMTSYVSRHSFATQAMLQQVPLNAISTMLGHSSLKTTEIYLKSLPSNVLDDYNALVIGN